MDQEKGVGDAPQLKQTNDWLMENNHQLRRQLEKTRGKYKKALEMANKNIADLNRERDQYQNDLAVANEEIGNLKIQLKKIKEKYKNNLEVANEKIENLNIQLKNKEEELKKSKDRNEHLKDYIRQVQSQQDDGQQIESVASVATPKASSTNNLKRRSDTSAVPKASSTNNLKRRTDTSTVLDTSAKFDKFDLIKNRRREGSRKDVNEPDDDCGLVIDQKKRPSNDDGSPTSLKKGNGNNGKRKIKERFETSCALVEETPQNIKRRNNKVEMTRIQTDKLKKDYRFFGSESESEGEMQSQTQYCLKCPKSFDSKKLLKQHMEIHVNTKIGEEPEVLPLFNCSLCVTSRSYHNAAGIFAHIQSKHTSQNVMNCSFRNCFHQVKESNKQDLLSHIRSKHTQEKLFKCDECPKDFSTYPALKDHEKKHASGKQCNNCLRFYTMDNCYSCSKKK